MSFSTIDICIATDWEYDRGFTNRLEKALQHEGCTTFVVWPHNLEETLGSIRSGELSFRYLYDRASNTSQEFLEIHRLLEAGLEGCLDDPQKMIRASNKAVMHTELSAAAVPVPRTWIVPAFDTIHEPHLCPEQLARLGQPFIIKPAVSVGGGVGVLEARFLQEVMDARRQYPEVPYLLQERVVPLTDQGRRFWFRVFHVCGSVICTWWNDQTHVYRPLGRPELMELQLQEIIEIVRRIAAVSGLRFFSTEIVRDEESNLVVVDYINETCDMRSQLLYADGVPDSIIDEAVSRLAMSMRGEISRR
jgi:glutathione synthase/RimK-type ligase-like ATP-grasp enzyme